MILDITIKENLIKLQREIKEKFKIDMSLEEIGSVYESQFQAGALAFKKGLNVRLPYFGVFIHKRKLDKFIVNAELNREKPFITEEAYKEKLLELQIQQKEQTSKAKSDTTSATIEDLRSIKDVCSVPNVFDKVLKYEG